MPGASRQSIMKKEIASHLERRDPGHFIGGALTCDPPIADDREIFSQISLPPSCAPHRLCFPSLFRWELSCGHIITRGDVPVDGSARFGIRSEDEGM